MVLNKIFLLIVPNLLTVHNYKVNAFILKSHYGNSSIEARMIWLHRSDEEG